MSLNEKLGDKAFYILKILLVLMVQIDESSRIDNVLGDVKDLGRVGEGQIAREAVAE